MATNFTDSEGHAVAVVWSRGVENGGGLCLELLPQACFVEFDTTLQGDDGSQTTLRKLCCDKAQLGATAAGVELSRPPRQLPRAITHGFEERFAVLALRARALQRAVEDSEWLGGGDNVGTRAARRSLCSDLDEILKHVEEV